MRLLFKVEMEGENDVPVSCSLRTSQLVLKLFCQMTHFVVFQRLLTKNYIECDKRFRDKQ